MADLPAPEESTGKKRILIVDDHAVLREGVAALINHEPDLAVCGQAASAMAALAALARGLPDLLLVDIALEEGSDGLELIRAVRQAWPALPQLVLSAHEEAHYAERALRAGAQGYVMKARSGGVLVQAIRTVLAGGTYLSEEVQDGAGPSAPPDRPPRREGAADGGPEDRLSQRELLVFDQLGRGLGSQEVARALGLSPHTIQRYRENIKRKLKLAGAAELQRAAFEYHYSRQQDSKDQS